MELKVMEDKYGKRRTFVYIQCSCCKKYFWKPKKRLVRGNNHFCSMKCRDKYRITSISVVCSCCNENFIRTPSKLKFSRSGLFFCSRQCKDKAQTIDVGILKIPQYTDGKSVYSNRAKKEYGCKCSHCGYNEFEQGLEVHHIDGNRKNNELSNLIVLCALCHRLVTNKVFRIENRKLIK
jgi:hypothetical protein